MSNIQINRRDFLKGTLAVGAITAVGALAGCASGKADASNTTSTATKHTWETAPNAITDIAKTENYDVVVVGGGMAGCAAAMSAAESGAKVVLVEKTKRLSFRGIDYAALASKTQQAAGIDLNSQKSEIVKEAERWAGGRGDERVLQVWADNCNEALDWVANLLVTYGKTTIAPMPREMQEIPHAKYFHYACDAFQIVPSPEQLQRGSEAAYEPPFAIAWADAYSAYAQKLGVTIKYSMTAAQLIKDKSGAIAGVVAQDASKTYTQLNAKSVILCTGGYGNDPEMMDAFIPSHADEMIGTLTPPSNTGDGIRMGAWVGGAIDPIPHCPMYFDEAIEGKTGNRPIPLTRQPWLYLNDDGERFENEDLPYAYVCRGMFQQKRNMQWTVWDSKWPTEGPKMGMVSCKDFRGALHDPAAIEAFIKDGTILSGNTLDELLGKMKGLNTQTAKATIAHYNELCAAGVDTDFGKRKECLNSITKAPFYAVHMGAQLLVTLGGLQINHNLNVIDKDGNPIPGLWAAGNCSGSFFFNDYPIVLAGLSHSRAVTFGRLAGKAAAATKA
ncbi:MAG: FAD-dependent oxidoreductase [Coriobacteriia bacterium]|nr:FAD-dependent oxidoreductase [Coriobacteriia bacterium]